MSDYTTIQTNIPTNIGVYNCDKNCYNPVFKNGIQPSKCGFTYINPEVYQQNFAPDFYITKQCPEISFTTNYDGRLIDVPRGFQMVLDRPPTIGSVPLTDVYTDPTLISYGQNYKTYSDITAGQILYYTDDKFSNPFFNPNFTNNAKVEGEVSFNPMDGLEVNYKRTPCVKPNNKTGLSWMNDSNYQREDIMSSQTSQIRQYDWTPRYT